MGFIKSLEGISAHNQKNGEFYDAEVLTVYFETKQEVVTRLLPPPLKPAALPIGAAFVANYPKTNFGVSYLESALFLLAQYGGEDGVYCLAITATMIDVIKAVNEQDIFISMMVTEGIFLKQSRFPNWKAAIYCRHLVLIAHFSERSYSQTQKNEGWVSVNIMVSALIPCLKTSFLQYGDIWVPIKRGNFMI